MTGGIGYSSSITDEGQVRHGRQHNHHGEQLTIFIVDDYETIRDGLRSYIAAEPDWTLAGEADSGVSALKGLLALEIVGEQAPSVPPSVSNDPRSMRSARPAENADAAPPHCSVDVVVLDMSLPDCLSKNVCAKIRERWPATYVVALAVQEDKASLFDALAAGASGYILKRSTAADVQEAIRAVAEGRIYIDSLLSGIVADVLVRGERSAAGRVSRRSPVEIALSAREEEIMQLISQGWRNVEISKKLSLSIKTIETYKVRAMEKLGFSSRADIVRYGTANGWLRNFSDLVTGL